MSDKKKTSKVDWNKVLRYWETLKEDEVKSMFETMASSGYFKYLKSSEDGEVPVIEHASPLVFLLRNGWFDTFDEMLAYDVDINLVSEEDGGNIIYQLVNQRTKWNDDERARLTDYLLKRDADPRLSFGSNNNAIQQAAYFGDFSIYDTFLRKYEDYASRELVKWLNYNPDSLDREASIKRTELAVLLKEEKEKDSQQDEIQEEQEAQEENIQNQSAPQDNSNENVDNSSPAEEEIIDDAEGLALLGIDIGDLDGEDNEEQNHEEHEGAFDEEQEELKPQQPPPVPKRQRRIINQED